MATVRWTDDRLDDRFTDITAALQVVGKLPQVVATHDVRLTHHDRVIEHLDSTLTKRDDKLDANSAQFRITPGMRLAATVPIVTSLVACVGVILASKGGN